MPKSDHLSKIRDAIDEFIGDDQPGTMEIDRPGKTDMVIITKAAFEHLVQAEARLHEIEGDPQDQTANEDLLASLQEAQKRPQ